LQELRGLDIPQAPAVMISTEAEDSDRTRAYAAGANAYLIKPSKPDQLLLQVRLMLGESLS
jgi:two-component system chemotaxis response regulator CheY